LALLAVSPWLAKNVVSTGNPVFPLANTIFRGEPPGWGSQETAHWDVSHRPAPDQSSVSSRISALARGALLDPFQRFNVVVVAIGLIGLFGRRLERADAALILLAGIQIAVWLFFTHLYARFLIPLIIPVVLLAARAVPTDSTKVRRRAVAAALIAAAFWSAGFSVRLLAREWSGGVPASVIREGKIPTYRHFGWINDLPSQSKILLIGEARAFYLPARTNYFTTFNRNPFLEMVTAKADASGVLTWLRDGGYTHLLVHWNEVARLARTYGFVPAVTESELQTYLAQLERAGLSPIRPNDSDAASGSTLYEIPAE
jgi:hypothetical protein